MVGSTKRLGSVFDDREIVLRGNRIDGRHVGGLTVDADGHDCFGFVRNGGFNQSRIYVPRLLVDVDKDGLGSDERDHFRCGNPGVRDGDDFIARTNAERHERDEKGVGAARGTDAVLHTYVLGEAFFEFADFWA